MKRVVFFALLLLWGIVGRGQGVVIGRVVDARSGENIEYATVALLTTSDSAIVNGTVTDASGRFQLSAKNGKYLLRITFIGYQPYVHGQTIVVDNSHTKVQLGKIKLAPAATMMNEVQITAERSMVEYQLDKRVVNVEKNLVTAGGTASDVLENVPSVAIDNDGNVTLRGSTNVKVLVNGRPSELLASDVATLLEQIPASTIENVEVITNPSAKYDPEGMSGIINIKLKDKTAGALGLNGVVSANVGAPLPFMVPSELQKFIPTASGNVSLNYSTKRYSLFLNADAASRSRARTSHTDIWRKNGATILSHDSLYEYGLDPGRSGSVKVGGEIYIDTTQTLQVSYQLRGGNRMRRSGVQSADWLNDGLYNYLQTDTNNNLHINHSFNMGYVKRFAKKDQMFTADFTDSRRSGNGNGLQQQVYDSAMSNLERYYLRETERDNRGSNLNIQLNYTHPFSDALRLEVGYEGRVQYSDQDYNYFMTTYDTAGVLVRRDETESDMHYVYSQQVHAAYATLGWKINERLSAQAGLRGEYASVDGRDELHTEADRVTKNYWQPYPTLHLSYQISQSQSMQLSYSRRVRRPHMWDLNPYLDVRQGMEMSFGNPNLDPEYTNSVELSYNIGFKTTNIFTSLYFRQTNNMMTRYGFVWDSTTAQRYSWWMPYNSEYDGYWASTWQNLNQGINFGAELILDQQILSWWKVNVSLNAFQNYIEGTDLLDNQDRSAFRLSGKLNSYMNFSDGWTVQLSGQYRAPFMDLQTDMDASYWVDLAVKKDVLQRRGVVTLRVSDLLCTGGFGHTTHNDQLDRVFKMRRISPEVTIGFTYKVNNGLRQQRNRMQQDDDVEGDDSY